MTRKRTQNTVIHPRTSYVLIISMVDQFVTLFHHLLKILFSVFPHFSVLHQNKFHLFHNFILNLSSFYFRAIFLPFPLDWQSPSCYSVFLHSTVSLSIFPQVKWLTKHVCTDERNERQESTFSLCTRVVSAIFITLCKNDEIFSTIFSAE